MRYLVKKRDTLWGIAKKELGDPNLWREIARQNRIKAPYIIVIGQSLLMPKRHNSHIRLSSKGGFRPANNSRVITGIADQQPHEHGAGSVPGRAFLFVLSDEVLPSGKLVRKVLQVPGDMGEYVASNPELFGIKPIAPSSSVSLGEHALGNTNSRFTSASTKRGGAPNMRGRPVYIDVAKAKAAGVTIHSTEEIIADLDRLAKADPTLKSRITKLKTVINAVEGEVLLKGDVPASAVKSRGAMIATRGFRAVQIVGVLFTVYDIGKASVKSVDQQSVNPIAAEGIRQVGGWGMGWMGMKLGCATGALLGIETGPGAVITCGAGGLIFGVAGYFGFDWLADFIDEN